MRRWKIIDAGPKSFNNTIEYTCPRCDKDALLPVRGLALAQFSSGGLVFDRSDHAMPRTIQCPHCRHQLTQD